MKELQEEKRKLEKEITKMLNDFQNKYGISVQDLCLTTSSSRDTNGNLVIGNVQAFIKIIL